MSSKPPLRRRRERMMILSLLIPALGGALALSMFAMSKTSVYYYSPDDLPVYSELAGREIRVGGLVAEGSLGDAEDPVRFAILDASGDRTVKVAFDGLLPGLFAEGQGVVVQGQMRPDGTFAAAKVLARHDENYMPAEVVKDLKDSNRWQHTE